MKRPPDGKAFVVLVTSTIGRKLNYADQVGRLYEACSDAGKLSLFSDMAFTAKSFQKLRRLLQAEISDESAKEKIVKETEESLRKFGPMLEGATEYLPREQRDGLRTEFLASDEESFVRQMRLLEDFAAVKDFLLSRRDIEF